MKKIAATLLSSALLLSPVALNSQVEASTIDKEGTLNVSSEFNELTLNPPTSGIELYGAEKPESDASVHDISKSAYNYQVEQVGAQVYTDKFIKGKTTIKVSVENWKRVKYVADVSDKVTITLYNSSGKVIDSNVVSISSASGSTSFSGLSASTKYYIQFAVGTTGNKYSFNGSIY